jgi:hypothetical protein
MFNTRFNGKPVFVAGTLLILAATAAAQTAMTDEQATAEYEKILPALKAAYAKSGVAASTDYFDWKRFNTAPYKSGTHGQRYVNNFANTVAEDGYGKFEDAPTMPVGSVLAKDSFKVTKKGEVKKGPLSIMEKMESGFNSDSLDWKYTLVLPNGKIMGTTSGKSSKKVAFCAACHNGMGAETDGLTFLPKQYRR